MLLLEIAIFILLLALILGGHLSKVWLFAVVFLAMDMSLGLFLRSRKRKKTTKKQKLATPLPASPPTEPAEQEKTFLPHVDETFFMSGTQFEQYVAGVYAALGYKVKIVGGSGDQGIDVIATKCFRKIGIQAKCYFKPVSNKAVMEAAAGKKYYRLSRAVVVTNSIFTNSAIALAKKCGIRLIDKRALSQMVKKIHKRT